MNSRQSFGRQTNFNTPLITVIGAPKNSPYTAILYFWFQVISIDYWWQNGIIPLYTYFETMQKWQGFVSMSKLSRFASNVAWGQLMANVFQIWCQFLKLTASSLIIHQRWEVVNVVSNSVWKACKTLFRVFRGRGVQKFDSFLKLTASSLNIHQ